jgi:hypothetical protein
MSDELDEVTKRRIDLEFKPIALAVEEFAILRGLNLEKYPRGNPGWELTSDHSFGGVLYLLLMHNPQHGLGIGSVWQFPCEEMARLYSHFRPMRKCSADPAVVEAQLGQELAAIQAVRFGHWTDITPLHGEVKTDDKSSE